MANDELRELIKDAPRFEHMERGELVAHAYGLFAAGNKAGAENAKLRELVRHMGACIQYLDRGDEDGGCVLCPYQSVEHDCEFESRMLELRIEVE